VVDSDVEIGVVADFARQAEFHDLHRPQGPRPGGLLGAASTQPARQRSAQGLPLRTIELQQGVHVVA
jgi:hypothetical protein